MKEKLFIIDQHAAHEKVLYERMKKEILQEEVLSQQISPPVIVSLTSEQIVVLEENKNIFKRLGFEITCFGGKEYSISGVPNQLSDLTKGDLFTEMLDYLQEELFRKTRRNSDRQEHLWYVKQM